MYDDLPGGFDDYLEGLEAVIDALFYTEKLKIYKTNQLRRRQSDKRYYEVIYKDNSDTYAYLSEDDTLQENDYVLVPVGDKNIVRAARIVSITYGQIEDAPYDYENLKYIIDSNHPQSIHAKTMYSYYLSDFEFLKVDIQNIGDHTSIYK